MSAKGAAERPGRRRRTGAASGGPAPAERLVWLLRHAKTETDPPPGGGDHERRLTARGRRDATALGRRLGDGGDRLGRTPGELPGLVLTSTAARTVQTVELLVAAFGDPPPVEAVRALYTASPEGVLAVLRGVDDAVRAVMVVGHNPTAQALSVDLVDPARHDERDALERAGFPTCALAVYRVPAARWADLAAGTGALVELAVPPF